MEISYLSFYGSLLILFVVAVVCTGVGVCIGKVIYYAEGVLEGQCRQHRRHEEQRLLDQQTNIGNRIFNRLFQAAEKNGRVAVLKRQANDGFTVAVFPKYGSNRQILLVTVNMLRPEDEWLSWKCDTRATVDEGHGNISEPHLSDLLSNLEYEVRYFSRPD